MDYLIESVSEIPEKIGEFFSKVIETIVLVIDALKTFYEMLMEFDQKVISMADSCGSSEFAGMPIIEAISTFRYLTGDVAFYMIYVTVLFGCLFTVYKLLTLLYTAIDILVEKLTGGTISGNFKQLLGKFMN